MTIYFSIFGLLVAGNFLSINLKKYGLFLQQKLFIFFWIFFVLFVGLRGPHVDNDYAGYANLFSSVNLESFISAPIYQQIQSEPLSYFIALCTKSSQLPLWSNFLIFAVISISLKLSIYMRLTRYPLVCLIPYFATYFLHQDMNMIRASVAVGMGFMALYLLHNDNRFSAITCVLVGFLFHRSALIILPFAIFYNRRIFHCANFVVLVVFLLLFLCGISISNSIIDVISNMSLLTTSLAKLQSYTSIAKTHTGTLFPYVILYHLIVALVAIATLWSSSEWRLSRLLIAYYVYGLSCCLCIWDASVAANRVRELFVVVEPLLFVLMYQHIKQKNLFLVAISCLSALLMYIFIFLKSVVFPYKILFM